MFSLSLKCKFVNARAMFVNGIILLAVLSIIRHASANEPEPIVGNIECDDNQFTCLVEGTCIPIEFVCDGIRQCSDGSDENMECETECSGFLCENGQCLSHKSWVCDGTPDCTDGSDERDCARDCIADNKKFPCGDNVTCIPIERVCNKERDCSDGSDEGRVCDQFHNNTACELHFCPEDSECFISPNGPICVCGPGLSYNSNAKKCEDIDECQIYGSCSQRCVNTEGSYYCTCADRFRLTNDSSTCQPISRVEPILFYAAKKSINWMTLESNIRSAITRNVRQPFGLSYDGRFIYWTNIARNRENILKSLRSGSEMEVLVPVGLSLPEDIAIDWITGNLYISDTGNEHIAVCSSEEGRMYWSEWGTVPIIGEALMDGTLKPPLIKDDIYWPNGIALDWPNSRLYWVDAKLKKIESCNLDGTGRHTVLKNGMKHPYGLAVFADNIYWSDWHAETLETCNKFTCSDRKVIAENEKIYDIHIYHLSIQPYTHNPCSDSNCTHLCLLASNETFTCGCPVGMELNIDKVSCFFTTPKEKIYIGTHNLFFAMEHETFGRHQIDEPKELPLHISKMTLNLLNGHVYIADNGAKIIYDYDPVKDKAVELVQDKIGLVSSMSFDHLSNNLYWSDSEKGTIEVWSLNKNQRTEVYHLSGTEKPIAIAVIPEMGHMFVALNANPGSTQIYLQSMNPFGNGDRRNITGTSPDHNLIQFAVDQRRREIYFCDWDMQRMSTDNQDGESFSVFKRKDAMDTSSIAILRDAIYWSRNDSLNIFFASKKNPDQWRRLNMPSRDYETKPEVILVAATPTVTVNHPCMIDNGGCSHICATYDATQKICLCPTDMHFADNQNLTCVDCEFTDCADASDERDCVPEKKEFICDQNEFKCLNGSQCVPVELQCDKNNDCSDGSDELDCNDDKASKPMCKWVCGEV